MIITTDEYMDMGFSCDDGWLLEHCLKRAEYTISAITEGRYRDALAAGGEAAECIKQAAGFQTQKLVNQELLAASKYGERVSLGDYSYSSEQGDSSAAEEVIADLSRSAVYLLKSSGCLYCGREVIS